MPKDGDSPPPAVEGVQVRLHVEKQTWRADELPVLIAEVRNNGKHNQTLGTDGVTGWEIDVDGTRFAGPFISNFPATLRPGQGRNDIYIYPKAQLGGRAIWMSRQGTGPLALPVGKHSIRVALSPSFPAPDIMSNAVEIEIVGTDAVSTTQPANPPGESSSAKLEFRIAPKPEELKEAELARYLDWLKAGKVGPWWLHEKEWSGQAPPYIWVAISGELTNAAQLVTGEYLGKKYLLVSDWRGRVMVPGEGRDAWGLEKVFATQDSNGRPAVGFELDDRGAELFNALAKANIDNTLAVVIDDQVVSARGHPFRPGQTRHDHRPLHRGGGQGVDQGAASRHARRTVGHDALRSSDRAGGEQRD